MYSNWYSVISHGNDKSQVYGSYGNINMMDEFATLALTCIQH
jgi:hypothetical protein